MKEFAIEEDSYEGWIKFLKTQSPEKTFLINDFHGSTFLNGQTILVAVNQIIFGFMSDEFKFHRLAGPCILNRLNNGSSDRLTHAFNGRLIHKEDWEKIPEVKSFKEFLILKGKVLKLS